MPDGLSLIFLLSYPFALILLLSNLQSQRSTLVMKLPMYLFLLLFFYHLPLFLVTFLLVYRTTFWLFVPSLLAIFAFFIFNTTHFATPNSITMSLLNARPGWINYSSNFSLLQIIHKKYLVIFLSAASKMVSYCCISFTICVSGHRHTRNNNDDENSTWKILYIMLTSPRFSSQLVNSTR